MMRKRWIAWLLAATILLAAPCSAVQAYEGGSGVDDAEIAEIYATIQERKNHIIKANTDEIYPDNSFNACHMRLLSGIETEQTMQQLIAMLEADIADYAFFGAMGVARLWYTFSHEAAIHPGVLSDEAERAMKDFMLRFLRHESTVERAKLNPRDTIVIHGSENHDIGKYAYYYLFSQVLKDDPAYANVKLMDEHTVTEHYNAWQGWVDNFFDMRMRKGLFVEINAPSYFKYTMGHLFDLHDFAQPAQTRQRAEKMLDAAFAMMTVESVLGQIGGARTRSYQNFYTVMSNEFDIYSWMYFKTNDAMYKKLGSMNGIAVHAALSSYIPPYELVDLAVNYKDRGNYLFAARTGGRFGPISGTTLASDENILVFPSSVFRQTYVTPDYMLGAMTTDPSLSYVGINSQNRWHGATMIANDGSATRVVFQPKAEGQGGTTSYLASNAFAAGSAMLVQRLSTASECGNLRAFIPKKLLDTSRIENGWFFAYDPDGESYIGIKPSKGELGNLIPPDALENYRQPDARFLDFTNQSVPFVVQMGSKREYQTFEAFIEATCENEFRWLSDTQFLYDAGNGNAIGWSADRGGSFSLNGDAVDLNPEMLCESPYFNSVADSAVFEIKNTKGKTFRIDENQYETGYKQREYAIVQVDSNGKPITPDNPGVIWPGGDKPGEEKPETRPGVSGPRPVSQKPQTNTINTEQQDKLDLLWRIGMACGYLTEGNEPFTMERELNRAELAVAVCGAMNYGVRINQTTQTRFTDVARWHWAAGAIETAAATGLMTASDGRFRPAETVTVQDALVAAARMADAGFAARKESDAKALQLAKSMGLMKGVEQDLSKTLTYEDLTNIFYQLLSVKMTAPVSLTADNSKYRTGEETFAEMVWDAKKITGIVTENHTVSLSGGNPTITRGKVRIDGELYGTGTTTAKDYLGQNVTAYVREEDGLATILSIAANDKRQEVVILAEDEIAAVKKDRTSIVITYEKNQRRKTISLPLSANVIYNNQLLQSEPAAELFQPEIGSVTLIDADGNGTYDLAVVKAYQTYRAARVSESEQWIITKYGDERTLYLLDLLPENVEFIRDGEMVAYTDIYAGDVLSVAESKDGSYLECIVSTAKVEGTMTEIDNQKDCLIDEVSYRISPQYPNRAYIGQNGSCAEDLEAGDYGVFALDFRGYIYDFKASIGGQVDYGFVIDVECSNLKGISPKASVKLLSVADKSIATYSIAEAVAVNGAKKQTLRDAVYSLATSDGSELKRQMIRYRLNGKKEITMIDTAAPDVVPSEDEITVTKKEQLGWLRYECNLGGKIAYNGETIGVFVSSDRDARDSDFRIGSLSFAVDGSYMVEAVDMNDCRIAKMLIFYTNEGAVNATSYGDNCLLVSKVVQALDPDENQTLKAYGMYGNQLTSFLFTQQAAAEFTLRRVGPGDVLSVMTDSDGCVSNFTIRYKEDADPAYAVKDALVTEFTIADKDSGYLITTDGELYYVGARPVLLADRKEDRYRLSSFDDLQRGARVICVQRVTKVGTPAFYICYR